MKKGFAFKWDTACQVSFLQIQSGVYHNNSIMLSSIWSRASVQFGNGCKFIRTRCYVSAKTRRWISTLLWPMPLVILLHKRAIMASQKWKIWLYFGQQSTSVYMYLIHWLFSDTMFVTAEPPSSLCKVGKIGNVYLRAGLGDRTQARKAQYQWRYTVPKSNWRNSSRKQTVVIFAVASKHLDGPADVTTWNTSNLKQLNLSDYINTKCKNCINFNWKMQSWQ